MGLMHSTPQRQQEHYNTLVIAMSQPFVRVVQWRAAASMLLRMCSGSLGFIGWLLNTGITGEAALFAKQMPEMPVTYIPPIATPPRYVRVGYLSSWAAEGHPVRYIHFVSSTLADPAASRLPRKPRGGGVGEARGLANQIKILCETLVHSIMLYWHWQLPIQFIASTSLSRVEWTALSTRTVGRRELKE